MIPPLRILNFLKPLVLNRYTIFLLFLLVYTYIMELYGGFPWLFPAWRLEIPLLLYLYLYGNMITRKTPLQAVIVAVPVVLLYAVFDVYHIQLGRLPRIIDVIDLQELFSVMPLWVAVGTGFLCGLPLLVFLRAMHWRRPMPMVLGLVPLVVLFGAVVWYPEGFMTAFEKTQKEIIPYSDVMSTANNGRISMALYNEARRKSLLAKTARYRENPYYLLEFDTMIEKLRAQKVKRNVHLIVLESFLDPELLRTAKFSRQPAHPDFVKFFKGKGGFSISPVFGGGTAQAEFELLCGVPALRELSSMEFNVFTGAKTPCLPNVLTASGYQTIATNAYRPDFFNSTNAYEGIGFEETYYPTEYAPARDTYLSVGDVTDEKYMFDGELLAQNLKFVAHRMKENPGVPLFNYVMTMYGHTPHQINLEKRPTVVTIEGECLDDQLQRAVSQHYYRTEAIAAFVQELVRIDPQSLIILVSDHLPPLTFGPNTYRDLNYLDKTEGYIHLNRIFFIENGKVVQYGTMHHHDVPHIILSYVTRGKKSQDFVRNFLSGKSPFDPASYRQAYLTIMAQAMNIKELLPGSGVPARTVSVASPAEAQAEEAGPGKNVTR